MSIKNTIILLGLLCMLMPCTACGLFSGNPNYNNTIKELQEEVPFKITIPTYFPDDIPHYLGYVSGPGEGINDESVVVGLHFFPYEERETRYSISIIEENAIINYASSNPSGVYLDIEEISVLEEDTFFLDPNEPSNPKAVKATSYSWNKNGINYIVNIFGYDREECLKIVESMITQIE